MGFVSYGPHDEPEFGSVEKAEINEYPSGSRFISLQRLIDFVNQETVLTDMSCRACNCLYKVGGNSQIRVCSSPA